MATARVIMTPDVTCASVNDTLVDAANKMQDLDLGALRCPSAATTNDSQA
jgi:CBS domain-containing protein